MGTPGNSTRRLLISMLLFVTIFATILWAANDPALVVAARDGDATAVRTLLAKRVNVNEPARDGSTALLWAVYQSDLGMVRSLVAAEAQALRLVVWDLSTSPYVDIAGASALREVQAELASREIPMRIVEARSSVRDLIRTELGPSVGEVSRRISIDDVVKAPQRT